jgi:UDP-N-acetylmuramoylalanine--D-glutamate ligase
LSDAGLLKPEYRELLNRYNIDFEDGGHSEELLKDATEVIKSPGIPDKVSVVQSALEKGIPVISEIELAGRYTNAFTVCITGSNGKTTTSSLIYHMMKKAGLNAGLAGNVGTSFARMVAEEDFDYYAIELSSFQLDGIIDFKPGIAVLLNITPDHLDRYDYEFKNYVNSKFQIIKNMDSTGSLIYCDDDLVISGELGSRKKDILKYPFSIKKRYSQGRIC